MPPALWTASCAGLALFSVHLSSTQCSSDGLNLSFHVHDVPVGVSNTALSLAKRGVKYGLWKWYMLSIITKIP